MFENKFHEVIFLYLWFSFLVWFFSGTRVNIVCLTKWILVSSYWVVRKITALALFIMFSGRRIKKAWLYKQFYRQFLDYLEFTKNPYVDVNCFDSVNYFFIKNQEKVNRAEKAFYKKHFIKEKTIEREKSIHSFGLAFFL